jgi:hypothetical protein
MKPLTFEIVWKQLFRAQWNNSKVKFSLIIESFRSHKMLLESQASLIELTEHRKFVAEGEERYRREKKDDDRRKLRTVRDWLCAANSTDDQENYICESAQYPGTGDWILRDNLVGAWSNPSITTTPLLWLTGIPGAGEHYISHLPIEFNADNALCRKNDPSSPHNPGNAEIFICKGHFLLLQRG